MLFTLHENSSIFFVLPVNSKNFENNVPQKHKFKTTFKCFAKSWSVDFTIYSPYYYKNIYTIQRERNPENKKK